VLRVGRVAGAGVVAAVALEASEDFSVDCRLSSSASAP